MAEGGIWNYRVMRKHFGPDEDAYTIREVYYNNAGTIRGWTERESAPWGETPEELEADVQRMLEAFAQPVLDEATEEVRAQSWSGHQET